MPNFYSNCAILTVNCVLYLNSNGTSPVGAGYYSDGVTCWTTNSSGVITGSTFCPTPTPTPTPTTSPTQTPTPTTSPTPEPTPTDNPGFGCCDCGFGCNASVLPCDFGCFECAPC